MSQQFSTTGDHGSIKCQYFFLCQNLAHCIYNTCHPFPPFYPGFGFILELHHFNFEVGGVKKVLDFIVLVYIYFNSNCLMMLGTGYSTMASCSSCGIKHARPVGIRCRRLLNVSARAFREEESLGEDSNPNGTQTEAGGVSKGTGSGLTSSSQTSQVENKLDLILTKIQSFEKKNQELEEQFAAQHKASVSSRLHSSPKCLHHFSGGVVPRQGRRVALIKNHYLN